MRLRYCRKLLPVCLVLTLCACAPQNTQRTSPNSSANNRKIAEINTQIAIEHLKEKDYALALAKLDKAIASDSNYPEAYNARGIVYSQIGENDKADTNFQRSLRIASNNPLALNNYGQFLCQNGKVEKAQEMFKRATDNPLYKTPEIALSNAGTCALNNKDTEQAEAFFRQALENNPRVPVALLQMASIMYGSERYLPARAYIQRYSEIARHVPRSLWLGVQIEKQLGDRDAEASYALALEKNFPDSKEAGRLNQ